MARVQPQEIPAEPVEERAVANRHHLQLAALVLHPSAVASAVLQERHVEATDQTVLAFPLSPQPSVVQPAISQHAAAHAHSTELPPFAQIWEHTAAVLPPVGEATQHAMAPVQQGRAARILEEVAAVLFQLQPVVTVPLLSAAAQDALAERRVQTLVAAVRVSHRLYPVEEAHRSAMAPVQEWDFRARSVKDREALASVYHHRLAQQVLLLSAEGIVQQDRGAKTSSEVVLVKIFRLRNAALFPMVLQVRSVAVTVLWGGLVAGQEEVVAAVLYIEKLVSLKCLRSRCRVANRLLSLREPKREIRQKLRRSEIHSRRSSIFSEEPSVLVSRASATLMKMDSIFLSKIEVWTHIGVPDEERTKAQRLLVTIKLFHPVQAVAKRDDLTDGINYADVIEAIQVLAKIERKTIERFAEDIASSILQKFSPEGGVKITVEKNPLLPLSSASVTITRP